MEILNSIWSILTTENETLTSLLASPLVFVESYLSLRLFCYFLKIQFKRSQAKIYVILFSFTLFISNFIFPSPINIFFNYIVMYLIIKKLFGLNNIKTFIAIIIPFVIFALIGILILNPMLKVFDITSVELNLTPIYRITYLCISYILVILLLYILHFKDISINLLDDINAKNKTTIYINLALGFLTLSLQLIITIFYTNLLPLPITFFSFITLFAYFLISFYSLTRLMKLQITTRDLESAENYNNTLSILYDNVKGFKHDFNNMLHMIGGYIKTNDMEGLKKYYSELENDCEKVKSLAMLNPNTINNPGIYNLLMAKYKKANELNIKINLEYFFDFDKLHMPIYQFSRMLGIFLDNAIEASSICNEKQINITFRDSQSNKTQIITIENTYANKEIDTSKIFEKGVSEKKDHMGIGLWEVNQILMRNNNIKLITTKNNTYFKQQLEIYY